MDEGELALRIYEIDQMFRHSEPLELTQLRRTELMDERRTLYRQLHPDAVDHGGNRHTRRKRPISFGRDVEVSLGISIATVNKLLARFDRIDPNVRRWISKTPIACNARELDCLTELAAENQRAAVAKVLSGAAKTVREVAERMEWI